MVSLATFETTIYNDMDHFRIMNFCVSKSNYNYIILSWLAIRDLFYDSYWWNLKGMSIQRELQLNGTSIGCKWDI